jgi:uncharacterized OB-fold protein
MEKIKKTKNVNFKKNIKTDPNSVEPHMRMDITRRNENIDAGKKLCKRCGGTGNELFSMYRMCKNCGGTGYLENKRRI